MTNRDNVTLPRADYERLVTLATSGAHHDPDREQLLAEIRKIVNAERSTHRASAARRCNDETE